MKLMSSASKITRLENIGYQWLAERHGIAPIQPFPRTTSIGRRDLRFKNGITRVQLPDSYQPEETDAGHLAFALKHEGVHLEFLARLFESLPPQELEDWIRSEPSGKYSRRCCFLYEWLTGRELNPDLPASGPYVLALDPDTCLTSMSPINVPR